MNSVLASLVLSLAPEVILQSGHVLRGAEIVTLGFSSDGRRLVSGSRASDPGLEAPRVGEVKIWDLSSGKLVHTISTDASVVRVEGDLVGVLGRNGLQLFDAVSARQLGVREEVLAFDFAARRMATAFSDRLVIEQLDSGKEIGAIPLAAQGRPAALALSRDGAQIALAADELLVIDVARRKVKRRLARRNVVAVAFSPDGRSLASLDGRGEIAIWSVATGEETKRFALGEMQDDRSTINLGGGLRFISGAERVAFGSLAFSADGKRLAAANRGNALVVGLKSEPAWVDAPGCSEGTCAAAIAWSNDGAVLATAGWGDGTVRLRAGATLEPMGELGVPATRVNAIATSATAPLVALGSEDGSVKVWDAASGRSLRVFSGLVGPANAVAFDGRGRLLAAASQSHLDVWDVGTGDWVATLSWRQGGARTVDLGRGVTTPIREARLATELAFSPDGRLLAARRIADLQPDDVALFDVQAQRLVRTFRLGRTANRASGGGHGLAFSPDGERLACGGEQVTIWSVATGEKVAAWERPSNALAWSPDGARLALTDEQGITVVRATDALELAHVGAAEVAAVAFGPDGRLAASNAEGELLSLKPGGELAWRRAAHADGAFGVAFLNDGRRLVSVGEDRQVRFWTADKGAALATLVPLGGSEFVTVAPSGHYVASQGGARSIAFREGGRAYPFEQFDLSLHRPDLVLQALGYAPPERIEAYRRAFEGRVARLSLAGSSDAAGPPSVEVRGAAASVERATLPLQITARQGAAPLAAIDVSVNGVPVFGRAGVRATARIEVNVPLAVGANEIAVAARDVRGVTSLRQLVRVSRRGAAAPRLFVLAVGVSSYRDSTQNLRFAERDAKAIVETFSRVEGIRVESIQLLVDERATRQAVLEAGRQLALSTPDDLVIVALAGHGFVGPEGYMFATTDTDFARQTGGVRFDELESLLERAPAQRKLLLLDTCQSGGDLDDGDAGVKESAPGRRGLAVQRSETDDELLRDLFADLRRGTGTTVIAASGSREAAFELADVGGGALTRAVLEGLSGQAPRARDGRIHVSSLRDYTVGRVRALTGGRQLPTTRGENLALDFALPTVRANDR